MFDQPVEERQMAGTSVIKLVLYAAVQVELDFGAGLLLGFGTVQSRVGTLTSQRWCSEPLGKGRNAREE